jgi:hypothetical protein
MIQNKKPSAYAAMGKPSSAPVISPTTGNVVVEPAKRGRPSKEDVRRQKMDLASAAIAHLCSDKPTRNKVREYITNRIAHLNEEKR